MAARPTHLKRTGSLCVTKESSRAMLSKPDPEMDKMAARPTHLKRTNSLRVTNEPLRSKLPKPAIRPKVLPETAEVPVIQRGPFRATFNGKTGAFPTKRPESRRILSTITNTALGISAAATNTTDKEATKKTALPNDATEFVSKLVRPSLHKWTILREAVKVSINTCIPEKAVADKIVEDAEAMEFSPVQEDASNTLALSITGRLIPENVEDHDARDPENLTLCAIYVADIYDYLKEMEVKLRIEPGFMMKQTEVTPKMRGILIDWLILVQIKFNLSIETFYLAIWILDRYLQKANVTRSCFQKAGVVALCIAAKYEEVTYPAPSDYEYITDKAYTVDEICAMECQMLKTLEFQLGCPLPIHFLRRYSACAQVSGEVHNVAKYIMELSLLDVYIRPVPPSLLAAGALYIARKVLIKKAEWDDQIIFYSSYTEEQVLPVAKQLSRLVLKAVNSKLQSIREKYANPRLGEASMHPNLTSDLVLKMAQL